MKKLTNKFLIGFLFGFLMIAGFNNAEAADMTSCASSDPSTCSFAKPFLWTISLDREDRTYDVNSEMNLSVKAYMSSTIPTVVVNGSTENFLMDKMAKTENASSEIQTKITAYGSFSDSTVSDSSKFTLFTVGTDFSTGKNGYSSHVNSSSQYVSDYPQSSTTPSFSISKILTSNPTPGTYNLYIKTVVDYHTRAYRCNSYDNWTLLKNDMASCKNSSLDNILLAKQQVDYKTISITVTSAPSGNISTSGYDPISGNSNTGCYIEEGSSSCNTNISWNVLNPNSAGSTSVVAYKTYSELQRDYDKDFVDVVDSGNDSGTDVSYPIEYGSPLTFVLYHRYDVNGVQTYQGLSSSTATAVCASGLGWRLSDDGTKEGCFMPKILLKVYNDEVGSSDYGEEIIQNSSGYTRAIADDMPVKIIYTLGSFEGVLYCTTPDGKKNTEIVETSREDERLFRFTPKSTTNYSVKCSDVMTP